MKTLYDDLEVSRSASKEVIEKAHRTLVKRYHPDLQPTEADRKKAEEKMKVINLAYDTLGDEDKKKAYDAELQAQEEAERIEKENRSRQAAGYNNQSYGYNNVQHVGRQNVSNTSNAYRKNVVHNNQNANNGIQFDFENYNYYKDPNGNIYRVAKKWSLNKTLYLLVVLGIINTIVGILMLIPPSRGIVIDSYINNVLIRLVFNAFEVIFGIFGSVLQICVEGVRSILGAY
jgi:curved DNA-binding protein CbpA